MLSNLVQNTRFQVFCLVFNTHGMCFICILQFAITMRGESTFLVRVETKVENVKNGSVCSAHTGIS